MKKIVDTHSHLYTHHFLRDQEEVIARTKQVCQAVFLPNIGLESIEQMADLRKKAPNLFYPMMGLHPSDVKEDWEQVLEQIETELNRSDRQYFAIGETGIDLYWDKTTLPLQQEALAIQIGWAKARQQPIILHAREAIDETADLMEQHLDENLKGIFHCFDGNHKQVERILEFESFMFGIGGIVTYRQDVQEVVREIPLENIVLETDSPYLPPEPHRKDKPRRNESSYVKYVCEKVAELKGLNYDEVAEATNANVGRLFGIYIAS